MSHQRRRTADPFDPASLTLDGKFARPDIACRLTQESEASNERHQQKLERMFVKVPFLRGMRIAEKLHMPAMAVWLELLRISFSRHGQNPVRLSNAYLRLNRRSKADALRRLEMVGEIRVTHQKGRAPLVTIISLPLQAAPPNRK